MIDINVACGVWPFRPIWQNDAEKLRYMLVDEGIEKACAYPLEAIFWPDPQEANEYRLHELSKSEFFIPTAVINPTLANMVESYKICIKQWDIPMIRLFPTYHRYDLQDKNLHRLLQLAENDGISIGIHCSVEDQRQRNPVLKELPDLMLKDITSIANQYPDLPIIAFCCRVLGKNIEPPKNLLIETSLCEGMDALAKVLDIFNPENVLFGTHAPLFYPKANVLKILRSDVSEGAKQAVLVDNASRLLYR